MMPGRKSQWSIPPSPSLLNLLHRGRRLRRHPRHRALEPERWTTYPSLAGRFLSGPWSPLAAAIVTALLSASSGDRFTKLVVHDERAYLLQAEIFAGGHWTAPSPPPLDVLRAGARLHRAAVFAKCPAGARPSAGARDLARPAGVDAALMTGIAGALACCWRGASPTSGPRCSPGGLWTTSWPTLHWCGVVGFSETTSAAMWLVAIWGRRSGGRIRAASFPARQWPPRWRGVDDAPADDGGARAAAGRRDPAAGDGHARGRRSPRRWSSAPRCWRSCRRVEPADARQPGGSIRIRSIRASTSPTTSLASGSTRRRRSPADSRDRGRRRWSREIHAGYTPAVLPSAFIERLIAILTWCSDGWRLAARRADARRRAAPRAWSRRRHHGRGAAARLSLVRAPAGLDRLLRGAAVDLPFPRGPGAGARAP